MGDFITGLTLFANRAGDVIDQLRGVQRGVEDLANRPLDFRRHCHALVDLRHARLHAADRLARAVLDARDHGGDFLGRGAGACGQTAHFIGDHGKTTALLTRPRCLDRRVERQQVGLVGDALDHLNDVEDRLGFLIQRADHLRRLLCRAGDVVHVADHLVNHPATLLGQVFGLIGHAQGTFGVAGDFFDTGGHLAGGSGHGAGGDALLLAAVGDLMAAVAELLAHATDAVSVAPDHVDHVAQITLHGRQCAYQNAGFVLAGGLDNRFAEIAMGNAFSDAAGGFERPHDTQDHPAPLNQQQQQTDDQHHCQRKIGVADGRFGAFAGVQGVVFDQFAERAHLLFELSKGAIERAELLLGGIRIVQRHADDLLGGFDVGIEARLDLLQRRAQCRVDRQLQVVIQHFTKMPGVLGERIAHFGGGGGAFAQADQHRRIDIGAQGVVHHVRFHVIAQRAHAHRVIADRRGHPQVADVTDQTHDQRRQQAGRNQQHQTQFDRHRGISRGHAGLRLSDFS